MKGMRAMKFGCIAAAALLVVSATGVFAAAEETESTTENETGIFEVEVGDNGTVELRNDTGAGISEITYTEADDKSGGSLLITEDDGTEHTFEDVDLTEERNYNIIAKFSFFYVIGEEYEEENENEAEEEVWNYEDADAIELNEPVSMYVLADMNIREEAEKDAEIVGSADVGTEVEVSGGTPIWFSVTDGDTKGYIAARYLTEDKEEAEEAAAAAAKTATTEAAQTEAAQTETAQSETPNTGEVETENGSGNYYQVDGVWYEDVAPDSDAGGYYYQVDGEWYEDVAPDSDAGGYFYYETDDGRRYRIMNPDAVSVGYDEEETELDDVDSDSDAGGYYYQVDGVWYEDVAPDSAAGY